MKKAEAISILATSVRPREPKDRARYDEAVKMAIEALKCSETPKSSERTAKTAQDEDLILRKAAIEALARMMPRSYTPDGSHPADEEIFRVQEVFADCIEALEILPPAQPTIYGYNVEHLELIARILQKENMPPERVLEVLTDIGRIVAIISDEFRETLRKSVEQCLYCADAERRTDG